MKKIAELAGRPLKWEQPGAFTRHFELRAGDERVATLHFRSLFGSFATGESGDGCWTFKRIGFLQTRVTVRTCGADAEIAVFKNNTWTGGGTLELPDGRTLLVTTNFWQNKLEIQDSEGRTLIAFQSAGLMHLSAMVEVHGDASALAELPWIVMLGWYLIMMMYSDTAAAAG